MTTRRIQTGGVVRLLVAWGSQPLISGDPAPQPFVASP